MPSMKWSRARRTAGPSPTGRLDRLADQWLVTNKARPRPDTKDDDIILTCGMKPDGTLLVLRFKTRAECDAWRQKTKLGTK